MFLAIISSQGLEIQNLADYIPAETRAITYAHQADIIPIIKKYAGEKKLTTIEVFPPHGYSKGVATTLQSADIIRSCHHVLIFSDGYSEDTLAAIEICDLFKVPHTVIEKNTHPLRAEEPVSPLLQYCDSLTPLRL